MRQPSAAPERPLLKPWYRLIQTDEGVLLEHGRAVVAFGGAAATTLLPVLLPLLDGTRTATEVAEVVGAEATPAVEHALRLLAEHDLLVDGPRLGPDEAGRRAVVETLVGSGPWSSSMHALAERIESARIRMVGTGRILDPLARLLLLSGLTSMTHADALGELEGLDGLVVVAPGADQPALLAEWNERALIGAVSWLPVGEFDGRTVSVGPLIVPCETACYHCLELRRDSTSGCAPELAVLRGVARAAAPRASVLAAAAALAADLIVRWVAVADPTLPGTLFTLETQPNLSIESHGVLRVPRCPICSPVRAVAHLAPWHEAEVS